MCKFDKEMHKYVSSSLIHCILKQIYWNVEEMNESCKNLLFKLRNNITFKCLCTGSMSFNSVFLEQEETIT